MAFVAVTTPIVLPWPLQSSLEAVAPGAACTRRPVSHRFLATGRRGCSSIARVRLLARVQEPGLPFHRRRHRRDHGARRTACTRRPLGTHDFPSGSDPAAAQDRWRSGTVVNAGSKHGRDSVRRFSRGCGTAGLVACYFDSDEWNRNRPAVHPTGRSAKLPSGLCVCGGV
jgi:hypothetical protein